MARRFREPDELRRWLAVGKEDGVGSGTGLVEGDEEANRKRLLQDRTRRGEWGFIKGRGIKVNRESIE